MAKENEAAGKNRNSGHKKSNRVIITAGISVVLIFILIGAYIIKGLPSLEQ